MKKFLFLVILVTVLISKTNAVPAYPHPIKYTQPDGSVITVQLKGDERVHWAESSDGYTLLSNGKNGWEYAVADQSGDLKASGILAREVGKRTVNELKMLKGVSKNIRFSSKQVNTLKAVWEAKYGSDKLIGTGEFFKKADPKSTVNDGRRKVFTPKGTKKLIMILIEFTDVKFSKTRQNFVDLMNTQNYNQNGAEGSVRDYFREQSYWILDNAKGFDVETVVAPYIYTADYDMAYYGAPNGSAHDIRANDLMKEAIEKADPDVDYTQYDNDNDGSIDGVYIIYAGYGEATGGGVNTIWPHAGGVTGTFDGKTASKYSCSNELNYNGASNPGTLTTIGVICHEFGHVCGAPDYYDTDYATGGSFTGNGYWDLMDTGLYNTTISNSGSKPAHFNPFEKVRAGWLTPITINATTSVTIPDISTNAVVYKYNTTTPDEYFLMENRQKTGFNAGCPGHGLMIYHYSKAYWDISRNKTAPQGFYPVCASAATSPNTTSDQYSYGNINSSGCPFPGSTNKTSFTNETTPSAKSWAGQNFYKPITNITENNLTKTVSFDFMGGSSCTPPSIQATNLTFSNIQDNQMTVNWTRGNGDRVIVLARKNDAVSTSLLSGTIFNANSVYQKGDLVDPDTYVIYDGDGTNVTITDLQKNLTYYFAVFEYTAATHCYTTTALTGSTSTTGFSVCEPTATTKGSFGITNVSFNTLNNSSGYSTAAYTNYSDIITKITSGTTYILSVSTFSYNNYTVHTKAWIDWNNDCVFDASTEEYDLGQNVNSGVVTTDILTPMNAPLGYVKMRVRTRYDIDPTACDNNNYSEAEDYTLKVVDVCVPPTTQASNFTATNIQSSQMTVNWTRGNGDKVLVIAHQGAAVNFDPISGRSYNANAIFKAGDEIGFGNYIVYNGTGSSVNVTGLEGGTAYYFSIYEYNQSSNCYLSAALTGNETTLCPSTALPYTDNFDRNVFSCWTTVDNTGNGSWQIGITKAGGYIPSLTGNYFYINSYSNNNSINTDLISPTFDLTSYSNIISLSFNHHFVKGSATASVYYSIDNGTNWVATPLATFTSTTSNPSNYVSVPLIALQGQSQVKFKWTYTSNESNYYWAIDDIKIEELEGTFWTGAVSNDWFNAGNWSSNAVPTASTNIIIPTGITNMPFITNTTVANCKDITLQSGTTVRMVAGTPSPELNVKGNWVNNGNFDYAGSGASLVKFNGTSAQTLSGSTVLTLKSFEVDNSAGVNLNVELRADNIALKNGIVLTSGTAKLNLFGGTLSRTNGWVNGTLQKYIFSSGSQKIVIYEIGDALNYLPVTLTLTSVTTAGGLSMKINAGDHPNISSSTLNTLKSVNRYWSFPTIGITFPSCNIVFNYLTGDIDASVSTANLIAGKYASSAWTYPTVGTKTSTSLQVTGITSLGDFALAEGPKNSVVSGGNWSNSTTWSPSGVPEANDNVLITSPNTVTIDVSPAVCNDLSIESGATLNIGSTKALTVNGAFTNNGTLNLLSDATGTATILTKGTISAGTNNINQYLTSPIRTWYMSSPVANAQPVDMNWIKYYDEAANNWLPLFDSRTASSTPYGTNSFVTGKGYSVTPNTGITNILFTGALNTGEKTIALTKVGSTTQAGFNAIGNPYPSYIDWKAMVTKNTAVLETGTMWYRTKIDATTYKYFTVDALGNVAPTGSTATALIPPMQGFWVKTKTGGGTFYFEDNMRSHASATPNLLKAPAAKNSELSLLRLQVSNGTNVDEAVIYSHASAENGYDFYDSPKMMNNDVTIPEIYTTLNNQPIVINVMNSLPLDTEIGLAFVPGDATSFSLRASEITNLPSDVKVILKDYANNGLETDLTDGAAVYNFAPATTTGDRFSVIFRSAGSTTAVNTNSSKGISVYSVKNGINVTVNAELVENATVRVFNAVGQQLANQHLTNHSTTINGHFNPGVYVIKISNGTANTTQKIVMK